MNSSISMPVSIYALGGLGEVGKNMYCIENDNSIIIIDCGVRFPGLEFPGVDYIIPDFTHLKNNRQKIKALFITHGHEDHIGGIPFLLQNLDIPVIYAPKLALELINLKLEENKLGIRTNLLEYQEDDIFNVGGFKVSFFRVTHSIPDSFGIVVDTSEGRIVSTGDFKVDLTPVGPDIALTKMAKLGEEGIDLLLSDSTNAESEGYTPSERNVYDSINEVFDNAQGRLIISTFSSNISRIQQICECAVKHNRKITILGRSMEKAVEISRRFGYISVPDSFFIPSSNIKLYRSEDILILCTGSQGEPMAALSRIANGDHKDVTVMPGDTVVFSSSAIPGNGIMIENVTNQLTRAGADVINNSILSDIHSSGHPSKQELRLVLKLMKPKYFMPMHGEYRMLRIHAELATTVGIDKENTFILDNGDCLTLAKHKVKLGYPVEHGSVFIDGKDIKGLASEVMEDRKILTNNGMMVISLSLDAKTNKLILAPKIYAKGIIALGKKEIITNCEKMVEKAIIEKLKTKTSYSEIKNLIKTIAGNYFQEKTERRPMIIPVIMSKN